MSDGITPEQLWPSTIAQESGGKWWIQGPQTKHGRAIGLTQILPQMAAHYGYSAQDLYDPRVQWDIYRQEMGKYLKEYQGDPARALAAWNAGETNVNRGIYPAETRKFVPKVLAGLGGALSPGTAHAEEPPESSPAATSPPKESPMPSDEGGGWERADPSDSAGGWEKAPPPRTPAPEERYQAWYQRQANKLPWWVPTSLGPQTPSELAVTGTQALGDVAMAAGIAGAPETAGTSMIPAAAIKYGLPLAVAPAVGAWEAPPGQRAQRAWEEEKKTALGLALAKPLEWGLRLPSRLFFSKQQMERSAGRIARGMKALFNKYPDKELATPETMAGIRRDIAGGRLEKAVGKRLGDFKEELVKNIPEYKPGTPGRPAELTLGGRGPIPPSPPTGVPFRVYTPDADGNMIPKDVSVGEGLEHIKKMHKLGFTAGGSESSGPVPAFAREAGHKSRESMITTLHQVGPQYGMPTAGTGFANHSADYGTAVILEDASINAQRTLGRGGEALPVIDQPALNKRIEKEVSHLRTLQPERVDAFRAAVAPTGASAVPAGRHWINPFLPESRAMYGRPTKLVTHAPRILAPEVGRVAPPAAVVLADLLRRRGRGEGGLPPLPEPLP